MPDSHPIPTTHIALWPFHRAPADDLTLWLTSVEAGLFPLTTSLLPGETPDKMTLRLLATQAPLTDLGYRYDLPLLATVAPSERRVPSGCVTVYAIAVPADWTAPALQRLSLLDALAGLRYAEHVETLMRLWGMHTT